MSTTLVIGDAHVQANQDLKRFKALGSWIVNNQPDTIIIIGDFLDMNALSAWDMNKRLLMEGRRYSEEIRVANVALDYMLYPSGKMNAYRRSNKKRLYKPELIYLSGNHEFRCDRYLQQHPELDGYMDYVSELRLKERGFIHVPYKEYYYHKGVAFTHIPIAGNGQPRSGSIHNILQHALHDHATSVVMGHVHKLSMVGEHRQGSPHYNQALSVGCFFEHVDEYAKGAKNDYWRGLVVLDQYSEGRFDLETIAMSKLLKEYL